MKVQHRDIVYNTESSKRISTRYFSFMPGHLERIDTYKKKGKNKYFAHHISEMKCECDEFNRKEEWINELTTEEMEMELELQGKTVRFW